MVSGLEMFLTQTLYFFHRFFLRLYRIGISEELAAAVAEKARSGPGNGQVRIGRMLLHVRKVEH